MRTIQPISDPKFKINAKSCCEKMDDTISIDGEVDVLFSKIQSVLDGCKDYLSRLAIVWRDLGLSEEQRQPRRDEFGKHLIKEHTELLSAMVEEEEKMKQKIIADVDEYKVELDNLCNEMKRSCEMPTEDLPLVAKAKFLKSKVDSLRTEKHERMKRLKRLAEMEIALCEILGEATVIVPYYKGKELPSEEKLKEFLAIIQKMEERKASNQAIFFAMKEKITSLWSVLEAGPSNEKQQCIMDGDIAKYVLCQENMNYLTEIHLELEKEVSQLEFKAAALREKVMSLWSRLAVPVEEREEFNQTYIGCHVKTIKALSKELERLEVLKRQNLKRFIEATRTELEKVWTKCRYGEQQKREFAPAFADDYSDDALSAHESELDKMKGFYEDHKDVFKLIDKREEMWSKMLQFEANASNPSRFENRGGKLLKEEKARKAIEKELPKVEKELESNLLQWEKDWERHFVLNDRRYLDNIAEQRQERQKKKDDEKQKRLKTKTEITMAEMMYGSKPVTPMKRKIVGVPTSSCMASPKNSPIAKKVRKVAPSPLVHSSVQTRPKLTKRRLSKGKKHTSNTQRNVSRRILSSKNSIIPEESCISQGFDLSIASTGNYSDFQKGLQQGLAASRTARSSVLQKNTSNVSSLSCLTTGTK